MGCQQSTPVIEEKNVPTAKSSMKAPGNRSRPKGVGATERMVSNRKRKMAAKLGEQTSKEKPKLNGVGQLMPEEVVKRTFCSLTNSHVTLGRPEKGNVIKVQYAYWTQRGYYPDDPHKQNQDEYSITLKFAGEDSDALFSVYDGHGGKGHDCARFAKKHLPQTLAKNLRQERVKHYQEQLKAEGKSIKGSFNPPMWPKLSVEAYESACFKSFVDVNKKMHNDESVIDSLSGTTAITASFHFGRLTVCNVGDSRVVLGHRVSTDSGREEEEEAKFEIGEEMEATSEAPAAQLVAIPMSSDQTPYRKDELERIKKRGGVIMSIDQMEGDEPMHDNWGDLVLGEDIDFGGDPPRVWIEGKDYPGCAFTRSIGDRLADDIGVNAEPEMITRELTVNDEILVIASDGIFEFLTNQFVIDTCAESESPLLACEAVVKAAYGQWLHHEDRTDDITVIVCFLKVSGDQPDSIDNTTDALVHDGSIALAGQKPIRIDGRKKRTDSNLSVCMKIPPQIQEEEEEEKKET